MPVADRWASPATGTPAWDTTHRPAWETQGYVGDEVAVSNLAGRTPADLVTTRDTALTRLPEPLRWIGVNAGLQLARLADAEERLTGRPALLGRALSAVTGH